MTNWTSPSGVEFVISPPETARDFLDGLVHTAAPLAIGSRGALDRALVWCARHVVELRGGGRVRVSAQMLDECLHPSEVESLVAVLLERAGLDKEVLDGARGFLGVIASGGCECKACAGVDPDDDEGCLYKPYNADVRAAVSAWLPLRDVMSYDMPVWALQLSNEWNAAIEGERARLRKEREAAKVELEHKRSLYEHTRARLDAIGVKI